MTETDITSVFWDIADINFLRIAIIVVGAILLILFLGKLLSKISTIVPARFRLNILAWVPLIRIMIVLLAIISIIPLVIRPSLPNLIAIFGALAVGIGFALKDYLSNLVAGIVTVFERPYRPGDWIKVNSEYGEVVSVGFRGVRIITPDDTLVIIPHARLWDTNILNSNNGRRELLCIASFYLQPEHEASVVRNKLFEVALASPYLKLDKPVNVIISEKPWYTQYQLKAYPIDARDQFQFTSDLTTRGKSALAKLGVKPAVIQNIQEQKAQ